VYIVEGEEDEVKEVRIVIYVIWSMTTRMSAPSLIPVPPYASELLAAPLRLLQAVILSDRRAEKRPLNLTDC